MLAARSRCWCASQDPRRPLASGQWVGGLVGPAASRPIVDPATGENVGNSVGGKQ